MDPRPSVELMVAHERLHESIKRFLAAADIALAMIQADQLAEAEDENEMEACE